jgi:hypothetical protein
MPTHLHNIAELFRDAHLRTFTPNDRFYRGCWQPNEMFAGGMWFSDSQDTQYVQLHISRI